MPPMHLLAKERRTFFENGEGHIEEVRKTIRSSIVEEWQREWDACEEVGQWTKSLISHIKPWIECTQRRLEYYTTQVLTGHGLFRSYTYKIRKTSDDKCLYCGQVDTPEHTVFHCVRCERLRMIAQIAVGEHITCRNLMEVMCKSIENWRALQGMIFSIMGNKEKGEREHPKRNPREADLNF